MCDYCLLQFLGLRFCCGAGLTPEAHILDCRSPGSSLHPCIKSTVIWMTYISSFILSWCIMHQRFNPPSSEYLSRHLGRRPSSSITWHSVLHLALQKIKPPPVFLDLRCVCVLLQGETESPLVYWRHVNDNGCYLWYLIQPKSVLMLADSSLQFFASQLRKILHLKATFGLGAGLDSKCCQRSRLPGLFSPDLQIFQMWTLGSPLMYNQCPNPRVETVLFSIVSYTSASPLNTDESLHCASQVPSPALNWLSAKFAFKDGSCRDE